MRVSPDWRTLTDACNGSSRMPHEVLTVPFADPAAVCMRHYVGMGEDLDDRLRAATTSVDMDKLLDLGCALADSDRLRDAEACFRRASDLGSPAAAFNLGNSLAAQECW